MKPGLSLSPSPRTKFVLMFLLFAMPITASYLTFFFWAPTRTNNYGELIRPVVVMPSEKFSIVDGKDAPDKAGDYALRGKWLIVTRDSGTCDPACEKKLYAMRQSRLILGKDLDRIVRILLIDDGVTPSAKIRQDFVGMAFVNAKDSVWLTKLPLPSAAPSTAVTSSRGYIYLVDPMGNLFMRYPADADIKKMTGDIRQVLKASQLNKDFEGQLK